MRLITSQSPVSDNRSVGAGSYRSFMLWAILIGLLINLLLIGLIVYYGTGRDSENSEKIEDYYPEGPYTGILGQLRLGRAGWDEMHGRDRAPGQDIAHCSGLYGQDAIIFKNF